MPKPPDADLQLSRAMQQWRSSGSETGEFQQTLVVPRPWRETPDQLKLRATYEFRRTARGSELCAVVDGHRVRLDAPVPLEPVHIPKPWGQEIWYTGMETRGESAVRTAQGSLPLSQYLALAPGLLCNRAPITLLKVLDPRPEPVLGDLYFELHEVKREVYVVTHIDRDAWPDGTGGIRFGMNQNQRRRYGSDAAFRNAYLAAVRAYEAVRRSIDEGSQPADPDLTARETRLRAEMEAFTETRTLQVGDVVVVPNRIPHSLQHGVRVVEFQTPTYERQIISFAQRVLTQNHWDSETAIRNMQLEPPPAPDFDPVAPGWQRLVAFEDFSVWRATMDPGAAVALPDHPSYALCMAVGGPLRLDNLDLEAEGAAWVPGWLLRAEDGSPRVTARNTGTHRATLLMAAPDL